MLFYIFEFLKNLILFIPVNLSKFTTDFSSILINSYLYNESLMLKSDIKFI